MKLAEGGMSWIAAGLFLFGIFIGLGIVLTSYLRLYFLILSAIFLLISILLVVFFRDPERIIADGIVSPADGYIREISKIKDKDVGSCLKISIFMNIHNVHVNRMPFDGKIKSLEHIDGSHIPAFRKESDRNERVIIIFDSSIGVVKLIQIAGTVARRIVPYINEGDSIKKGERIGLIRLGSRVDIYLPEKKVKSLSVKLKDKVKAGVDTIAEINV